MENVRNMNPIKVDKTTIINLEKGKLPPQALDLEEAVLGAMMIDKKGVDEVIDILQPDAFYKEAHKHIFEAIVQLFTESQPIDLLTVSDPRLFFLTEQGFTVPDLVENKITYKNQRVTVLINKSAT